MSVSFLQRMLLLMEVKTYLENRGCNSMQWSCRSKICCYCFSELLEGRSLAKNCVIFSHLYRTCLLSAWLPESGLFQGAGVRGWEQNCPFSSRLSDSWAVTWNPEIEKLKPRSAFISESSIKAQFLLHRNVLLDSACFQVLVQWRMTGFPCCSQWVKKHFLKSKS